MTEHDALQKIENEILSYWGCDPQYYIDKTLTKDTRPAILCCKILEYIAGTKENDHE